nr:immunoglobulin light chain junction region [Macaca mulatta]
CQQYNDLLPFSF